MQRGSHIRKTTMLVAATTALVLIGVGAWIGVRTLTPTGALAGSTDQVAVTLIFTHGTSSSGISMCESCVADRLLQIACALKPVLNKQQLVFRDTPSQLARCISAIHAPLLGFGWL
jgi:hypothetical protein